MSTSTDLDSKSWCRKVDSRKPVDSFYAIAFSKTDWNRLNCHHEAVRIRRVRDGGGVCGRARSCWRVRSCCTTTTAAAAADACCACAVGARCWSFPGPGARQLRTKATIVCFLPPTPQYQYNWRHNHETREKAVHLYVSQRNDFQVPIRSVVYLFNVFNWEMYKH